MSGLDPLAALAAQALANAQAAMDQAILSLGVDVAVLQAQVNVGEVIAATVLAPQGGTDLLSFLGQTVTAQLPPGINPGETIALQVTGFTNSAVIVKNLGTIDPENPIPTVNVELPPQEPGAPQSAILTTVTPVNVPPATPVLPPNPGPKPAPIQTASTNVAPPREVFVAASVRQNVPVDRIEATIAQAAEQVEEDVVNIGSDVEARLALSRASVAPAPPAPAAPSAPPAPQATTATPSPPPRGFPVAPPIVRNAQVQARATPEAALLARLRIPVTPITLAAARTVSTAAQSVTAAYERLESALAQLAPEEGGALRSMLAFVARFDLRNTRALPEQLATFISDVLDGAEAKIAQAVSAWSELELPQVSAEETPPPTAAAVAATAAERTAAMDYDVKSAILAMINSPSEANNSPAIAGALHDALTATTALQLNVLNAQATDPRAVTIPLPAYFREGGEPAMLRISRDTPNGKNKMDADNFHIAFVLDTKTLGTVAIDVQTVGRVVSVDVKTQATTAADRLRSTLGDLRLRLEQLHYRVAAIAADVAPPRVDQPKKSEPLAPPERKSFWDMRA
jgi:hypothetical protein